MARKIALSCYPEYKGRKIKAVARATYYMDNAWGGGSRCFAKAINLATGAIGEAAQVVGAEVEIPAGVAIVEHAYFCGQDCGITIYINPAADKAGLLTAVAS